MTKGGKKRKARSESQDSLEKYIPQFNKKRKLNNDSEDNLDRIKSSSYETPPVEENTVKLVISLRTKYTQYK